MRLIRKTTPLLIGFFLIVNSAINAQDTISVPNIFTPNEDTLNDDFKITIANIVVVEYDLVIFNRWGELMFNSKNRNIHWDGRTTSGVEASSGTYYYLLSINEEEYYGSLSLVR